MGKRVTTIIAGFPGTGLEDFVTKYKPSVDILDLTNSEMYDELNINETQFTFIVKKELFENIGKYDIIVIPTNKRLLNILNRSKLIFNLFYPDITNKEEYLIRFIDLQYPIQAAETINENWDNIITGLSQIKGCRKFKLEAGAQIYDIMEQFIDVYEDSNEFDDYDSELEFN